MEPPSPELTDRSDGIVLRRPQERWLFEVVAQMRLKGAERGRVVCIAHPPPPGVCLGLPADGAAMEFEDLQEQHGRALDICLLKVADCSSIERVTLAKEILSTHETMAAQAHGSHQEASRVTSGESALSRGHPVGFPLLFQTGGLCELGSYHRSSVQGKFHEGCPARRSRDNLAGGQPLQGSQHMSVATLPTLCFGYPMRIVKSFRAKVEDVFRIYHSMTSAI